MTEQPPAADLHALVDRLNLEQKVRLLTGADSWALHAEPAVGLRRVVTSDGPAGVRGERWDERDPSANVPSPTALAASWDEGRVERIGRLLAAEARRKGVDVLLAPTVNLHRTPYGGRHFESYSEDPLLTARMGAAYVRGLQSAGVAATVKHVVANDSETERFTANVVVDERTLRELYLEPFRALIAAGAWAVMAAYNAVNGATMTESPMLHEILADEWGFDGVVMSDWYATRSTEPAARAGLDLAMPGPTSPWGEKLVEAVRAGQVPEPAIDDKVMRLLRLAGRVGALDGVAAAAPEPQPMSEDEVAAEVRGAAAAGFVLVRNEIVDDAPVLPLDRGGLRRVAVVGPNAGQPRALGGGSATVFPAYTISPLDGLRNALGNGVEVAHRLGVTSSERVAPAPVELLRVWGTDEPGVQVRFLEPDGRELAAETRRNAAPLYLDSAPGGVALADVATVEMRAVLRLVEPGSYTLGASGVGQLRVTVSGQQIASGQRSVSGNDPVEAMMAPPQLLAPVELPAGDTEVVAHLEPGRAGGFNATDGPGLISLQLNLAPRIADPDAEIEAAVTLARDSDVAVVVVGTTEEVESEGYDRDSLALPGRQDELVRRVAAANPRTVVVVNAGAPVLMPWAEDVAAVLLCWFPGQEFGAALAEVLLGKVEPGGRLPTSWPSTEDGLPSPAPVEGVLRYDERLAVGYRGPLGKQARYPFGHGLGYTTWSYGEAEVNDLVLRLTVRNTGSRRGREVVQVYATRDESAVERPVRWLVGYTTVHAEPEQEVSVEVPVPSRTLAHWDVEAHTFVVEPGSYRLEVGRSSRDIQASAVLTV